MSEPKLISPMLDGFLMGAPMSSRQGVQCCPAMPKDSDKRYIVKIISIPASQVQLEALLLTGAYASEEDAMAYFQKLADDVLSEVQILKRLSSLEGFLPYEACQAVRKEGEAGYEVYLLSPYKRSLERVFRRHTMTHLNAINLGLDLCASLAVCRRAGYLYVDLKPENIFMSEDGEFRIGDLGFIPLESMQFASLDQNSQSPYTPPEAKELFSSINGTLDTYGVGMILYQAYNDGKLPVFPEGEALPAPEYADYEMAEIILKAIDPEPEKRWPDPIAMGQALVAYMQKNGANDTPITTSGVSQPSEQPQAVSQPQQAENASPELQVTDASQEASAVDPAAQEVSAPEETALEEDSPSAEPDMDSLDSLLADLPEDLNILKEDSQLSSEDIADSPAQEASQQEAPAEPAQPQADPDDPANLSFMGQLVSDETAPSEELAADIRYDEVSLDTFDILSQADALISHETPAGVVAPEPIDVPIPPPIVIKVAEPEPQIVAIEAGFQPPPLPKEELEEEEDDYEDAYDDDDFPSSFSVKKILLGILVALLIGGICFCGYFYYKEFYLQTISSLEVTGKDNSLAVQIVSDVDETLLTAVCTDTYGTRRTCAITGGTAVFHDLNADTLYTISIEIDGFHKLVGRTTDSYTTAKKTNIISFTAIAGAEDGSATLRFKVDGQGAQSWRVVYSTEGEEERTQEFTDNMVTVTGLTVGKTYTFQLKSDSDLYIVGNDTLTYTVLALVEAQDVQVTSCSDGKLTAQWVTPEGKTVDSWTVRCYNEAGYDQAITTSENYAEFLDVDTTQGYTVEVTAQGMTSASRAFVTANSVTITAPKADTSDPTKLVLSWDYTGPAPEGEWLVLYTIDNCAETEVVRTTINSASIANMVPGATYKFVIQTQAGVSLFGGEFQVNTPDATPFEGYTVASSNFRFTMCQTPDKENWEHKDIENFTNTFKVGQKASFKLVVNKTYNTSPDQITTMYVIRDKDGTLISKDTQVQSWTAMWYLRMCELDVPKLPQTPGDYKMEIYFNGHSVHQQDFTIVE